MAKSRAYEDAWISAAPSASTFAWIVAVFAVVVQLNGAFLSIRTMGGPSGFGNQDPLNTVCTAVSLISIVIACSFVYRDVAKLLQNNKAIIAYILLVVTSVTWSIHPDLTIRRSPGCILTILVAAYLSVRFTEKDRMKVLSFAFAICAIGSLLFVAANPYSGIDNFGAWRGVFGTKNLLGQVMAVAIFIELYLLVLGNGRPIWRFGLLGIYFTLLTASHSLTSLVCAVIYLAGTAVYIAGKGNKLAGLIIAVILGLPLLFMQVSLWYNADLLLSVFGKDASLTGRTDLWIVTLDSIKEKPLLGQGFAATWVPSDPQTTEVWKQFGWPVPNAHSSLLDTTLQLGLLGLGLLLTIIVIAWQRARACCRRGILPLGWFSLMLIVGIVLFSLSETGVGYNQNAYWLLLIVFTFSCGLSLASLCRPGRRLVTFGPSLASTVADGPHARPAVVPATNSRATPRLNKRMDICSSRR